MFFGTENYKLINKPEHNKIRTETSAARKSSAIMPIPNLIFSDFLIKLNFEMSKNLNNKNPIKWVNGFNPENAETISWPAASSITIQPGSLSEIFFFNLKHKYVPKIKISNDKTRVKIQP